MNRRAFLQALTMSAVGSGFKPSFGVDTFGKTRVIHGTRNGLTITGVKITPIAVPDAPLLNAAGCHGPYFFRNVVELRTDSGIIGIGETRGGLARTTELKKAAQRVIGRDAFAVRKIREQLKDLMPSVYAGIELACLDACGKAMGKRICDLLGGPVRNEVEFAAYLFYRYAADHPALLKDSRLVDKRGTGSNALDDWGEVRTAEAMTEMAKRFRKRWGFQVLKLKAGILSPEEELRTMRMMHHEFGKDVPLRIDPNGRWTISRALSAAKQMQADGINLEYYEDPVTGQEAMAKVREMTGLTMSTNMCVTRFEHIPRATRNQPIDVILGDHHGWGGMLAFLELGRLCEIFGWQLSQHSNNHCGVTMAAMVHVGASTPQLTLASDTHYVWLAEKEDIIEGPKIPIVNGKIRIPKGVGLGVSINQDKLAIAQERYQKCGMHERDDRTTMRMLVPGWERTPID